MAIDPGISTGWALFGWRGRVLLACGAGPQPPTENPVDLAVIELPQVYRAAQSKGDPNDLITLAVRVGRYQEQLESRGTTVELVHPATWKGQISKAVHHPRILAAVATDAERAVIFEAAQRISKKALEDMLDAIGLGIWYLHRAKVRV